ncbi:hypothetical protein FA13DRAFT_1794342 [Coprinellus micaceus]|uniref:MYND-type domain-containing protein n=1 Tax=Coprinellus micaceus TaxID=71717 RepID=A0A4Y7T2B7_COPMI|nr:hypothetical protein FA13DRAFT_1794342 [Coprinellus micaceus]
MFLAAKKGGWNKTLFQDLDKSTTRLPRTKSIQEAYALALGLCEPTFEGKRGNLVRLCCSMTHSNPIQKQEDVQSLKICSRCHSVVYCSEACQREDWVAFHSKECHEVYRHQRELEKAGLTERYRRDKAMFLAFVATRFLGDRNPTYFGRSMKDDDLPLHLFDFTGVTLRITNHFVGIVEQTLADFFSQYVITPHAQGFDGAFIDRRIVTTICIQMQYSPYSTDGERYKVIKAVSSAKLRSSLPEPEPLTEADAQLFADMGLGL